MNASVLEQNANELRESVQTKARNIHQKFESFVEEQKHQSQELKRSKSRQFRF